MGQCIYFLNTQAKNANLQKPRGGGGWGEKVKNAQLHTYTKKDDLRFKFRGQQRVERNK